jgi:prepilin-type N-terminal cleavage/methylation domain-containing protein
VAFKNRQGGFTIIELLVVMSIFSIASIGFYAVLFSSTRASNTSRSVAAVSSEARLGFNRLVRDVREGVIVCHPAPRPCVEPHAFRIQIDFDGNLVNSPPGVMNSSGDYEDLTIGFNKASGRITLAPTTLQPEVLMEGVDCVQTGGVCSQQLGSGPWSSTYGTAPPNVFSFTSNRLEYDWNNDGVVTWQELDMAPTQGVVGVGNNNGRLDGGEIGYISNIGFKLSVRNGDALSDFTAQAQLRNQR